MEYILIILSLFTFYGGSYAAALATASSFYAVFFFFWTRTGNRKDKIVPETKKVYLHTIYSVLRISLAVLFVAKVLEVFLVTNQLQQAGLDVTWLDTLMSHNVLLVMIFIILLGLNSFLMSRRAISFTFALPFAVVTYLFLFLHITSRSALQGIEGYVLPSGTVLYTDFAVYVVGLIIGAIAFNYYAKKVLA